MPENNKSAASKIIADLQIQFKYQLSDKLKSIENAWKEFCKTNEKSLLLTDFQYLIHNLAGSSGTFGAVSIGNKARNLEVLIKSSNIEDESTDTLPQNIKDQINELLVDLKETADKWQPSIIPFIQPVEPNEIRPNKLVYLAEDDEILAEELKYNLEKSGYIVRHFMSLDEFEEACNEEFPAIIIMDIVFKEGDVAGANTIKRLNKKTQNFPPVVFISVRDDIQVRLAAAQAGASRYFSKPLNINKLISTLDGLTECISREPYRVLIIDDDENLLQFYAISLDQAGLEVKTLSNPLDTLKTLSSFQPDVIVTDVYMSKCSGPELAQVIRQDDTWLLTPILFLSTESNLNNQLSAMSLGGDDFLVKPITASHLISSVNARAKRARWTKRLNKDMLDTLRENEYQLITMNQHDIVSVADTNGKIISVNDKFCDITGYDRDELLGENHRILKSGKHDAMFYLDIWSTISQGNIWHGEICNRKKDGSYYWVQSTIVPFLDADGLPYKYVSARTDITPRITTEERLRESEEKYRLLFELSEDPMWVIVGDQFMMANKAAVDILDYNSIESLIGTHPSLLSPKLQPDGQSSYEKANEMIAAAFEQGYHRFEWVHKKKNGIEFPVDVSLTRVPYKGKQALFCVWRDITKNKEAEAKIREDEERFAFAVEGAGDGVWDWDIRTNEVNYSDIWMSMLGYSPNELPYTFNTYTELVHIDDLPIVKEKIGNCMEGKTDNYSVEVQMLCKNGDYKWILSRGHVIHHNVDGMPVRMTGIHNDISNQKEAENALILAREEAEKANFAKSEFLSSMSHELRTPMNAIIGFGQLLDTDTEYPLVDTQKESVAEIVKAGEHLLKLINEVLDLAKIESGQIELSNNSVLLGEIVAESIHLIEPLANKRGIQFLSFVNNIPTEINALTKLDHTVWADSFRVKQVLLNLLSNAVKYNKENGKITIEVDTTKNKTTRICITDSGIGLSEKQLSQLFKPFNRLGAEQTTIEGTGIGLVITKNIVEAMKGSINVQSDVDKGSTFWFDLPKQTSQENSTLDQFIANDSVDKTAEDLKQIFTVLYIEDNPANLRLVSQLLARRSNIKLLTAPEAILGLQLANEYSPDLILLDINLPGLDGYKVLNMLRQREATRQIPIFAISANAMAKDIAKGLSMGFNDYITKPIDITTFLHKVDNTLTSVKP